MKTAEQYMIALTVEERTPSVKAMVDIILLDAAKAIDEGSDDLDERIDEARQTGFDIGYESGYQDGRDNGYDDGYSEGHTEGYNTGYEDAKAEFSSSNDHLEEEMQKVVEGLA